MDRVPEKLVTPDWLIVPTSERGPCTADVQDAGVDEAQGPGQGAAGPVGSAAGAVDGPIPADHPAGGTGHVHLGVRAQDELAAAGAIQGATGPVELGGDRQVPGAVERAAVQGQRGDGQVRIDAYRAAGNVRRTCALEGRAGLQVVGASGEPQRVGSFHVENPGVGPAATEVERPGLDVDRAAVVEGHADGDRAGRHEGPLVIEPRASGDVVVRGDRRAVLGVELGTGLVVEHGAVIHGQGAREVGHPRLVDCADCRAWPPCR